MTHMSIEGISIAYQLLQDITMALVMIEGVSITRMIERIYRFFDNSDIHSMVEFSRGLVESIHHQINNSIHTIFENMNFLHESKENISEYSTEV